MMFFAAEKTQKEKIIIIMCKIFSKQNFNMVIKVRLNEQSKTWYFDLLLYCLFVYNNEYISRADFVKSISSVIKRENIRYTIVCIGEIYQFLFASVGFSIKYVVPTSVYHVKSRLPEDACLRKFHGFRVLLASILLLELLILR